MRRLLFASVLTLLPGLGLAQSSEEEDKGYLTNLLEENLSGGGREVVITGFAGALSSKATIDTLTIADDIGIWLTLQGVQLDWSRAALLTGKVEIDELSADLIDLARLPEIPATGPAPEAKSFSLPDLPVSINIGKLNAARVQLGESILGQATTFTIDGAMSLEGGEGSAALVAERLDAQQGRFEIDASYGNESQILGLDLNLNEAAGGIAATLLDIPGAPSVALRIQGTGPISTYSASLQLDTDGQPRLSGRFAIAPDGAPTEETDAAGRRYLLDLSGDVTALFLPDYRDFFGPMVTLHANVLRNAAGETSIDALDLTTDSMHLEGSAQLAAEGWPSRFALTGQLKSKNGSAVLLPLTGPKTTVDHADLTVSFDASLGDQWSLDLSATGFDRPGLVIPELDLTGGGQIVSGEGDRVGSFTAALDYAAKGVQLDDAGLAEALGDVIGGTLRLTRTEDQPTSIDKLTLSGPGISAEAVATIAGAEADYAIKSTLLLKAEALERFATLTGRSLQGAANLAIDGTVLPTKRSFSALITGSTQDLGLGIAELDPLLTGAGTISGFVERDAEGSRLRAMKITTDAVDLTGEATLTSGASDAVLRLALSDIGLSVPELSGPAVLDAKAARDDSGVINFDLALDADGDRITAVGLIPADGPAAGIEATITAALQDLGRYNGLSGQRLGGSLSATVEGTTLPDASRFDLTLQASTGSLRTGFDAADKLLAGQGTISARIFRPEQGGLSVSGLEVATPNLTLTGDLAGQDGAGTATYAARIADIGLFTPDFSGAATAEGTAARDDAGDWSITSDIVAPGGTTARLGGTVGSAGRLDLSLVGQAPLALLNGMLEPRRVSGNASFDLALNGEASLQNLSGRITASGARLSVPTFSQALENIEATVDLSGGTAEIALTAAVEGGGRLDLRGPVGLAAPQNAELALGVVGVKLRDPSLYDTTLDGQISISGGLAGGARIAGVVNLGPTEIQVPSSDVSVLGELPVVVHKNAPAAVRATLDRAGLTTSGTEAVVAQPSRVNYPLDITVNAPSRMFVRGRGLDAELGGTLRLTGTTAAVIPSGQFTLIRGRLNILQQRFDLTDGSVSVQGDFTPFVRLLATTSTKDGTQVTVGVEGPATEPEVTFTSSPDLPQDEILARLIFGRDLSQISALQAVQLAAAVGTLAGRGGVGVVERLRTGIGLDDFDVTSDEEGAAAVRAGKYLSENIYTDITIGTSGTSEISLNLDINEDFTAKGTTTSDGESSVGLFFERDY